MNDIYEHKAKKYKYIGGGGYSMHMHTRIRNWFTPNIWKERQKRL